MSFELTELRDTFTQITRNFRDLFKRVARLEASILRSGGNGAYVRRDGSTPLTANWDAEYRITVPTFYAGNVAGGNYYEVESDGTAKFNGDATVWEDANVGATTLFGPAATQPDLAEFLDSTGTGTGIYGRAFDVGEKVSGDVEIPHSYKEGSDLYFHLHWQGITAPTGTDKVQWELTYCIADPEVVMPAATTITVETDFDTQYENKLSAFAAISGASVTIMGQFIFTLERIAATTDEYGGDALVQTVGLHYEQDTGGSRQISTK